MHDVTKKLTIDKIGVNTAAIENVEACLRVGGVLRLQNKYLNNIVEQVLSH